MATAPIDTQSLQTELSEASEALKLAVSSEQQRQLLEYLLQLHKWNKSYNLSGLHNIREMLQLHVIDSLTLVPYIDATRVADIGTGAGLPGMVLAIIRPDVHFTLIDSNSKKIRFLFQTAAMLGLNNVETVHSRADDHVMEPMADIITSRAFSSLAQFITCSEHLLAPGGKWLAMKGQYPQEEIEGLPPGVQLKECKPLHVPGVDAARHMVDIRRVDQQH